MISITFELGLRTRRILSIYRQNGLKISEYFDFLVFQPSYLWVKLLPCFLDVTQDSMLEMQLMGDIVTVSPNVFFLIIKMNYSWFAHDVTAVMLEGRQQKNIISSYCMWSVFIQHGRWFSSKSQGIDCKPQIYIASIMLQFSAYRLSKITLYQNKNLSEEPRIYYFICPNEL
jgi:hypothetical protein